MGKLLGTWGPKVGGILILIAGALSAIGALLDGDPNTVPNWEALLAALGAVGIGFTARANLVTSESSGAFGPVVQDQAPLIEAEKVAVASAKSPATVAKQTAAIKA